MQQHANHEQKACTNVFHTCCANTALQAANLFRHTAPTTPSRQHASTRNLPSAANCYQLLLPLLPTHFHQSTQPALATAMHEMPTWGATEFHTGRQCCNSSRRTLHWLIIMDNGVVETDRPHVVTALRPATWLCAIGPKMNVCLCLVFGSLLLCV